MKIIITNELKKWNNRYNDSNNDGGKCGINDIKIETASAIVLKDDNKIRVQEYT